MDNWLPYPAGGTMAREEVLSVVIPGLIGCYGAVHWSLCWRSLSVTFSGLVFWHHQFL